jgi:hypothetical protein
VGWNSALTAGKIKDVTMGHRLSIAQPNPITMNNYLLC